MVADAVRLSTATQTASIYNIYADHLNTPRLIMDDAVSPVAVWRWDNDEAFGRNAPDENPQGAGPFVFNMRLPGQYFDAETNLHYNYFRDYDPEIGRYVQSDPMGLEGGISTYGYVGGDSLGNIDMYGLLYGVPWQAPPNWMPQPPKASPQLLPIQYYGSMLDFGIAYVQQRLATKGYASPSAPAGWVKQDLYFHCRANCEAAQRGRVRAKEPKGKSFREWLKHLFEAIWGL